ncbi:MAG: hypothetical protein E7B63_04795 [Staphylococcus epidermidis]|nr:hypothetical protein [Staphylococcus epidermidis]MDU1965227.1 hypothetical protein [Staphylococcus lugdunensis]MDU2291042.1 hypothetical protein [Clostridium celatum]MDU4504005.1 hypothetical protein [Staphylococcus warneri]MDU1728056.1 hypothetical protein [Staphylococcus epidermidis]
MYFKNMDFLIDLYKNFNEVGIFAVIYIIYALIQILSQNILYKRQKMERVKTLIINIILYIFITLVALMYLLAMIFYSLSAYPKEEVIKYITDWDKISLPAILLVLYSLLFPIFIFPFVGKRRRKNYFAENVNNCIIEREIIDRVSINGRDKLILKDALGYQTEKDITGIKDLKISTSQKKSWLTLEDIKIATMSLRDKQLLLKMIIGLIIFGVPTGYFVWNFISVVDDWDRIMHANDIFMYMGLFTLPLMVTVELYVVAFVITKNLFKKKK